MAQALSVGKNCHTSMKHSCGKRSKNRNREVVFFARGEQAFNFRFIFFLTDDRLHYDTDVWVKSMSMEITMSENPTTSNMRFSVTEEINDTNKLAQPRANKVQPKKLVCCCCILKKKIFCVCFLVFSF